jgi:hypothetical protein
MDRRVLSNSNSPKWRELEFDQNIAPEARCWHSLTSLDENSAFLFGGRGVGVLKNDCYLLEYNPETGLFESLLLKTKPLSTFTMMMN